MPHIKLGKTTVAAQISEAFNSESMAEDACRRLLLPIIRPEMVCPICGVSYDQQRIEKALSGKDVICGSCRRKASPRSGTILDGVHCGFREVLLISVMLYWGISPVEISRRAKVSDDTVRRLAKRIGGDGE